MKERLVQMNNKGFTLLFALLVASVLLGIGVAILNIGLREVQLSGSGRDSQHAFYAADTGLECALYWDFHHNAFSPNEETQIECVGDVSTVGGDDISFFELEFNGYPYCASVTVDKSGTSTVVEARGYNSCDGGRRVERGIRTAY